VRTDRFTHLHVASGYSLRYGASHPEALVARAAEHGQSALALTDRDGVYGAVKFAKACLGAGIGPIFGADLAVRPSDLPTSPGQVGRVEARRTPVRGGATVDPRHPRVVVLARNAPGRAGWAALNRLVSSTHLGGDRGRPVTSLAQLAEHAAGGHLLVLLGPSSELGRALAARRPDLARAVLDSWRAVLDPSQLIVEVVSHHGRDDPDDPSALSSTLAARMLGFARDHATRVVLTGAVRYADRDQAVTADVLDAARRLVALDRRHVDRRSAEGYLKSDAQMAGVAAEVVRLVGGGDRTESVAVRALLDATDVVAQDCVLDPRVDLGLGGVFLPELETVTGGLRSGVGRDPAASAAAAQELLRARCEGAVGRRYGSARPQVRTRLEEELDVVGQLGYATYFLTVADVVDLIRGMDVRVAARGSGAGSLVNYLLGISGVDPLAHGLVMERFLSPLRRALPDIDIDVESARRGEVYERILERFGADRCACVSMMDTYRVRHAVRDVGAALGLPPGEIDSLAKAFPHIRARDARAALADLPELRASRIGSAGLDRMFDLVERLDGLPRHVALHPCGVLLSDATLLDRTAVEASFLGYPMSQFDKDDVEDIGLLKLDVLGIRMQSAMAHAVQEIRRVDHVEVDLDTVPLDDQPTYALIRSTHTLGCFQIESPGQRELIGKFGPETFDDLITDISLFRPGPVKSDMVTPFLRARQGWEQPHYLHPALEPALAETYGVVVFHEQVLRIVSAMTRCTLAEADEVRRSLGSPNTQPEVREWFYPLALAAGFPLEIVERVWSVLQAFASFGFCKAHAAAFALPTYHSAWLKAHHPAAFLAGVLTHDPGMYPRRLILDDARQLGISVLPLDVNASDADYRVERVGRDEEPPPGILGGPARPAPPVGQGLPDGRDHGIRLALSGVKGISAAEVDRVVAGRPYSTLSDFWHRARVSRPVVERLVVAGAFDSLYGIGSPVPVRRRGQVTRRDLLLQVADLDRWRSCPEPTGTVVPRTSGTTSVQLTLALGPAEPDCGLPASGLPEMSGAERVRAELDVLGLDVSRHVVDFYTPMLDALGVTRSRELLRCRSEAEILVAGVKVATQTPPVRSGRRVVFLTLDDATGPVDATFFEDAQGPYAATVFHSWLLIVRGHVRRTGHRGVSIRATGAWEMATLYEAWVDGGVEAVRAVVDAPPEPLELGHLDQAVEGAAGSRSTRPVLSRVPGGAGGQAGPGGPGGGMGQRRVLVHPSGFRQSPYADVGTPGEDVRKPQPRRKLWHSSPGSSGA
jgi:error-prone DNA polymerase